MKLTRKNEETGSDSNSNAQAKAKHEREVAYLRQLRILVLFCS